MNRPQPHRFVPRRATQKLVLLLGALMLLTPGCVEISRTETSRYGDPLQGYGGGTRQRFEANEIEPPSQQTWFEQLFDW